MTEKEYNDLLQETHDMIVSLHAVVVGSNGDKGIFGELEDIKTSVAEICTDYNKIDAKTSQHDIEIRELQELEPKLEKLTTRVWLVIVTLAGAGVLGVGAVNAAKIFASIK